MVERDIETRAEVENDMQAEADDSTMPETKEKVAPEAGDEALPEHEAGNEAEVSDGHNSHSFDVVAVHGLYGHREDTWTTPGKDDAPGSNWLNDQICERYPGTRILTFGYDASATRAGVSTMAGIRAKALQLLDDVVELRKASSPDVFRPIIFVGHDLGGIIIKEALCIATPQHKKYENIKASTRLLIFFGCPHRCTSTGDMEDKLVSLLLAKENPRPVGIINSIKELAQSIIAINGSFVASNILSLLSIVNVYSEERDAALQIFDKYTATLDVAFEQRIGCPKPHKDMCRLAQDDDLYQRIDRVLSRDHSPLRPSDALVKCLQNFCSLAAPVWPLESFHYPEHRFHWIPLHESYTTWLYRNGPSILHVFGTTGAFDAAEYIFQCLDEYRAAKQNDGILVYFAFNRHDDRQNSVTAMLNTLLAQILNHNQNLYEAVPLQYELMSFHRSWTQADLFFLFRNVLMNLEHGGIMCVINGLDECDDSQAAFLKSLCSFAALTERGYKIAITSTTDSNLQAALVDWPTINLDEQPEDADTAITNLVSDMDLEVQELMQRSPALAGFEKTIKDKLFECGQDRNWRRLVLNQLKLTKTISMKLATQRELDILRATSSNDTFAQIVARVPFERRAWARKALNWILYAFYPLRVSELGVALALDVDSLSEETIDLDALVYQNVIADLEEVFGGMFIVKHNEVHFGHPDAREFLLAAEGEQEHVWYNVKQTAHQEITNACHFYLSLQQVQDSMVMRYNNSPGGLREPPNFVPQYSLVEYAIKYWPRHYKLIAASLRPTERALKFIKNKKVMRRWSEAHWLSSNSISRTDRAFLCLLPVLAGLGLQDLVSKSLHPDAETPEASQDRALALTEATRNAHVELVRMLLRLGGYDQTSLQDALVAGVSCCDVAVLDELVKYVVENIENFEWPPAILCRAAQFDLENTVKKLLESGASLDKAITVHDMTPLYLAARHGHAGVVKLLLEYKASVTTLAVYDRAPLHTASMYGHAAIVKLLLDAGADVNVVDIDKKTAMDMSGEDGNYKALEIFAEARCDLRCDKQGDGPPLVVVAYEGFIKSARLLLDMKADTEVEGPRNWTPLRFVARNGHVELCRLLLDNGANANTLSGGGPILGGSASEGNLEVLKLLIENGAAVDAVDSEGWTALQRASRQGHISVVTYLLDHGADINHTNESGETSILLAAAGCFADLVRLLIERGADLHRADAEDWTPIHLSYDDAETTRVLMESRADPNRLAKSLTPLFLAASWNYIEVVKVLLSFNPHLETCDSTGHTALSTSTLSGYTDIVRLLLEAGANINHRFDRNYFPLQSPVTYNREDLLRTLMEYHPALDLVDDDGDTALHCISTSTSLATVKLLINAGSNFEICNNQHNTVLCRAVEVENLQVVKYLIAKKAKLNITCGIEGGPLHIACRFTNLALVKTLVAAGADVNLVDSSNAGAPIQAACWNSRDGKETQESIIRYLIDEAEADVATVGGQTGCALNAACGWSTPDMVKLMVEKGAKIDVEDGMGRVAIHFAAAQSMGNFQAILDAGGDVEARDKIGRTTLHWATIGGVVDVVDRVLSLARGLLDQTDIDGWTPLLWAAKGVSDFQKPVTSNAQKEIIALLLDRGSNPCVRGKGLGQEWSTVKVARYHGVDEAVVSLLIAKQKEKLAALGEGDSWDEAFHTSKGARIIHGICYKCETCLNFGFCHKCYLTRHLTHPNHSFQPIGTEYEPEDEFKDNDDSDSSTDNSSIE